MNAGAARACSSLSEHVENGYKFVTHWATEFKRDRRDQQACTNQVTMAMVSGLYQRRALGLTNHFVFGTVHIPGDKLVVLAGRWNPQNDAAEQVR